MTQVNLNDPCAITAYRSYGKLKFLVIYSHNSLFYTHSVIFFYVMTVQIIIFIVINKL